MGLGLNLANVKRGTDDEEMKAPENNQPSQAKRPGIPTMNLGLIKPEHQAPDTVMKDETT